MFASNIQKMKIVKVKLSEITADPNLNLSAKYWIKKKSKKNGKQKSKNKS